MVAPQEALQRAVRSMTDGPGDPTSIEGAKVNALESIAWSPMGPLAEKIDEPEKLEDLSGALQNLGFVTVPNQ